MAHGSGFGIYGARPCLKHSFKKTFSRQPQPLRPLVKTPRGAASKHHGVPVSGLGVGRRPHNLASVGAFRSQLRAPEPDIRNNVTSSRYTPRKIIQLRLKEISRPSTPSTQTGQWSTQNCQNNGRSKLVEGGEPEVARCVDPRLPDHHVQHRLGMDPVPTGHDTELKRPFKIFEAFEGLQRHAKDIK